MCSVRNRPTPRAPLLKAGSVSGLGGIRDCADVQELDFLAPVENRLRGFRELGGSRHGDFTEIDFAGRAGDRDVVSPRLTGWARQRTVLVALAIVISEAPMTAGMPHAVAIMAAWETFVPVVVRIPDISASALQTAQYPFFAIAKTSQ